MRVGEWYVWEREVPGTEDTSHRGAVELTGACLLCFGLSLTGLPKPLTSTLLDIDQTCPSSILLGCGVTALDTPTS